MTDWLWNFILYVVPWWAQVLILAGVIGVPSYLVVAMIWGRDVANRTLMKLLVPFAAILGALALLSRQRQHGYNDRRAEEEKALDKAEEIVEDERTEVQKLPDVELDEKVDRWSKP